MSTACSACIYWQLGSLAYMGVQQVSASAYLVLKLIMLVHLAPPASLQHQHPCGVQTASMGVEQVMTRRASVASVREEGRAGVHASHLR
jgi:hypothetical protein